MPRPLYRWTVGNTTQQGLDILEESVFRTMRALGDGWDWMICHNGVEPEKISRIVQGRPVELVSQTWSDCPVDDEAWSPIRPDGSIEVDGGRCGGTLWKVCPPRMRPDSHEIIADNDLIIMRKSPQIDLFLSSRKTLILEEPIRFYGRYDHLIPFEDRINSGLMGCPPGFDFGARIRDAWRSAGRHTRITQGDEQGLLMAVLRDHPNIRLPKDDIREFQCGDLPTMLEDPRISGYHFVQANRTSMHRAWLKYRQIFRGAVPYA